MNSASFPRALSGIAGSLAILLFSLSPPAAAAVAVPGAALAPGTVWLAQGPGPTTDGQVEGIADGEVVGAIQTVAAHPTDADVLFVGGVNGGIWKTLNAASPHPVWQRLTDDQRSNTIGALEFDPTDSSRRTLLAGIGQFSSFGAGGALTGLLRTRDAGLSWTAIDGGGVVNKNISGVAARGNTLVVAIDFAFPFTFANIGIWRSTNGGASFTQIATGNGAATGLPGGVTDDLVGDPQLPNRLFTSVRFANLLGGANGVYRSDDTGAHWTKVSSPAMDALIVSGVTSNVEFAVGRANNVYAAIVNSGELAGFFRSGDGGATWTAMDLPMTFEGAPVGIHPGFQGSIHLSLAADPTDANVVYVGGDRQPLGNEPVGPPFFFPNSIGANDFSGRLFRGNASRPPGSQWVHLTHSRTLGAPGGGTASSTAPHADSREMTFDAAGNLIETDDGGIYKRTRPRDNTGDWFSLIGNLETTEFHDAAYDALAKVVIGGAQDTGVPNQERPFGTTWSSILTADGGDVAVDDISSQTQSNRYSSNQFLGAFNRTFWDRANNFVGFTFPALTVVGGGAEPVPQFVTPVKVNAVNGERLVISAFNSVYESFDQGETIRELAPAGIRPLGSGIEPLAYGARGNPDALYVGAGPAGDEVWIRTAPPPAPLVRSLTFPGTGQLVTDVAIDPDDGNQAFVCTRQGAIYRTTNAGASWTTVTGNLPALNPLTVQALAFANTRQGDAVIAGTQNGVYFATAATGFSSWHRLGNGLPAVPVFDLDYDAGDDLLIAGTMGRGAWKLPAILAAVLAGGN